MLTGCRILVVAVAGWISAAPGEPLADPLAVRDFRERLATGTLAGTQVVIREMVTDPHSKWGELLLEAMLRGIRTVEMARIKLPDAELHLQEVRKELREAQAQKLPSRINRITPQVEDALREVAELEEDLRGELVRGVLLVAGIGEVSRKLGSDGLDNLADKLGSQLRRLRKPDERVALLQVLGEVHHPSIVLSLMKVVRDPVEKPDTVLVALQSLGKLGEASALPAAVAALEHRDWRVQSEAIELMRVLHRRSSIPFLIEQLGSVEGRLRDDIGRALNSLTGQKFAPDAKFWNRWWDENRDTFVMPAAAAARKEPVEKSDGTPHFYGIQTHSRRVVFVLDMSGSMKEPARNYGNSKSGGRTKIDVARTNLKAALQALHPETLFNVVLYSNNSRRAFREVQPATQENKQAAIEFSQANQPGGGTNIYAGLVDAFDLAGASRRGSRKAETTPQVDTVYFLTDGQPTVGTVKHPQLILAEVEARNRLRRIRIHTVGVGKHDKDFLRKLAEQNRGTYIAP